MVNENFHPLTAYGSLAERRLFQIVEISCLSAHDPKAAIHIQNFSLLELDVRQRREAMKQFHLGLRLCITCAIHQARNLKREKYEIYCSRSDGFFGVGSGRMHIDTEFR
ncbi:hypothetical protein A9995_14625 [Erythrobacter sp. QSSC1-22B]|nr:hypothetical protein A9995_14625 [Erythrobacter sp. QSSC1-22B]